MRSGELLTGVPVLHSRTRALLWWKVNGSNPAGASHQKLTTVFSANGSSHLKLPDEITLPLIPSHQRRGKSLEASPLVGEGWGEGPAKSNVKEHQTILLHALVVNTAPGFLCAGIVKTISLRYASVQAGSHRARTVVPLPGEDVSVKCPPENFIRSCMLVTPRPRFDSFRACSVCISKPAPLSCIRNRRAPDTDERCTVTLSAQLWRTMLVHASCSTR